MVKASNQVVLVDDFTVIKEGDTVNSFVIQLLSRNGDPVDLTGADVTWTMANSKGVVLTKTATLETEPGTIKLDIAETDATGAGTMRVEIKVNNAGAIEKFPGHGYLKITISPSLENLENEPVTFASISYFTKTVEETNAKYTEVFNTANEAKQQSESTQTQLNQVVIDGDSSVEAAQARVRDVGGETTTFNTLKERNDNTDTQLAQRVQGETGKSIQTFAGVIRNTGTGWDYIDDTGHAPVNMDVISLYNGSINVHHTPNAIKVGTLIATPDETYANDGLICGASVGMTNSYIHLHFPLNIVIDGSGSLTLPTYFTSTVTGYLSSDKSQVVIDHPPVSGSDIPQVICPTNNRENADYSVSYTDTQVIVTLLKNMSGHVYYDSTSSSFKYLGANIDDFTFSFDTVTGELTIGHVNITGNDVYSISITGRDGYYEPKLSVPLTNSFKVKFYDDAGNLVTTPDSNMRVYFSRPNIKYKSPMQASNKILIKRGHCKADASDVENTGANIWINGLMEI